MITSNIMDDASKQQKQIEKLRCKMQNNVVNEDKVDKINIRIQKNIDLGNVSLQVG